MHSCESCLFLRQGFKEPVVPVGGGALEFSPPASPSQVLGLQASITMPCPDKLFECH